MTAISARGLCVSLRGRSILKGVSLELRPGEVLGLVGANGSGKSTLLRALTAELALDAGEIELFGRALHRTRPAERARTVAYLPQARVLHAPLSVVDLARLGRLPHRRSWAGEVPEDAEAVRGAMALAGVSHLAERPFADLSGGEQARALLARALSTRAPVLLADEPVDGLDPRFQLEVMRVLRAMAATGTAVLVTLHELSLASRFCHRLVLLAEGRVEAAGAVGEVLAPDHLARAYGIEAHYFQADEQPVVVPRRGIE